MLKSSRLVAITGCLLGLSVTLLPLGTHAVTITQEEVNVSATINGYLSLVAVSHTDTTGISTYDDQTNTYSGTFNVGDHTDAFGTTRYQVSCNFLTHDVTDEHDNTTTVRGCENGWNVTAEADNYNATTDEAEMIPSLGTNAYRIKSIKANGLTGANSNWLMKVAGVTRTFNGNTTTPTPQSYTDTTHNIARNYGDANFEAIPYYNASRADIVHGNTFTGSGTPTTYSYNGYQEFDVTYGFSAGHATADTYTGTITYTLSINAS